MNYTKRVVGLSEDTLRMVEGRLAVNDVECEKECLGVTQYRSDYGPVMNYDQYQETLAGTNVTYVVQYDPARKKDVRTLRVPSADVRDGWFGKQELVRFAICGDNRSQSADSITNDDNGVLAQFPCEACVIGSVAAVIFSNHGRFQMHDMVSGVSTSWIKYLITMPKDFVLNSIASLQSLDRVFLRF